MDDIPQDVLHSTYESAQRDTPPDFLRSVANDFTDRADRERALRKKAWQSRAKELDTVAGHLIGYAEQLAAFIANNPDGVLLVGDDETRWEDPRDTTGGATDPCGALHPHLRSECVHEAGHSGDHGNLTDGDWASSDGTALGKPLKPGAKRKEAPQLPGNTGRCASFRRATPGDGAVCALERGHEGNHVTDALEAWPRTPSGHVCGDVVVLHDGTALNCQRPLGHDGDEHHDGRYRFWPRGVGTSRQTNICERCNMDTHACPGCGEPIGHYAGDCGKDCTAGVADEPIPADQLVPGTVPPCGDLQPDIATALGTSCMLPKGHTGKHIGYTGARWDQVAATLGDIAEQQRATMVIPEQRETVENVEREMRAELAVIAAAKEEVSATVADLTPEQTASALEPVPVPRLADVLTAEFKEEVSATVTELSNPFQTSRPGDIPIDPNDPIHGGPTFGPLPTLGNPFQAPPPPPAAFLPPHLVPGAPKAHQSHSSITTMEKCGLQYRLKYRDGIGDDTPAWWNVAGTVFHTVVQAIEATYASTLSSGASVWALEAPLMAQERQAAAMWKEQFSVQVDKTERESGKARSTWKAAKGGKEGEAFWREYGGDLARMYVAHRRKFLAEPEGWRLLSKPGGEGWAHEVEFNATVDGVLLKGFIDSAWISADGATILIEDFKSGSSEGDPFQPKLYGMALRALGFIDGRRVITRFYEARKGAHSATVELTPADDAEVFYRAKTAQEMDRLGIFPPSPSGYNCSTCPVKSRCPIMATKS